MILYPIWWSILWYSPFNGIPADYDKAIYRFADYNSGMYSSRNAAFQSMLNAMTKTEMVWMATYCSTPRMVILGQPKARRERADCNFAQNNILVTHAKSVLT